MWFNQLFCILTFVLLLPLNNSSRFKFTNVVCQSLNQSLFEVNTCRLKAMTRHKTVINFDATLKDTINRIYIHGEMFKRANGYKPWLYNLTVEGCRFYKRAYDPVAKLVYNLFKPFSNLNHSCPYLPGPIRVWGFYLLGENVPIPMPSGDYLITILWSINNNPQLSTNISFSFQEDF